MKKSNAKKKIAILMATAMCLSIANMTVSAKEPIITDDSSIISPLNIAITSTKNSLTLGSLGKLTCYGQTDVQYGYNAGVTVELQQYSDGWNTIKTWSDSNSNSAVVDQEWYVNKGYSYRLKLTHKAYNSDWNTIESITKYSNQVVY